MGIIDKIRPAIVAILRDDGPNGTGFLVTSDGYIITAYHVIKELPADNILVETSAGEKYQTALIEEYSNKEDSLDFAILKIKEDENFYCLPLKIGFKEGDQWTTFGYESIKNYKGVPNAGKILGRAERSDDVKNYFINIIAYKPVKGGMSGAPLFSKINNAVIGVIEEGRKESNEAMALPIEKILETWPELKTLNSQSNLLIEIASESSIDHVISIPQEGTVEDNILILRVKDFKDSQHWCWLLTDSTGKILQKYDVCLNVCDPYYDAFIDLYRYLKTFTPPCNWIEEQDKILKNVGAWIGRNALGPVADYIAKLKPPVVVRVKIPPEASELLYRPWEIAIVEDTPLAFHNISLIFELPEDETGRNIEYIRDKLRILAIFSLPTDVSPLALRRERYELMYLINSLAQNSQLAIELRVIQYGATRENLERVLLEGDGWDIIHFSCHGEKARLILEKPDGSKDSLTSDELADLLNPTKGRLKLVMLSSCLSAATTIEETMKWLKIETRKGECEIISLDMSQDKTIPALAWMLVNRFSCAVIAMRYPVSDEFAINIMAQLYDFLLDKGQTLERAMPLSIQKVLKNEYSIAKPPFSLAAPAIFGHHALGLSIRPPSITKSEFTLSHDGFPYFPPEPRRFVGRTESLGRASQALAPRSDKKGILFYGMAGAGKTACALEMAHHQHRIGRFAGFVWYEAPKRRSDIEKGNDIERTIFDLAQRMERSLDKFEMVYVVDNEKEFEDWLPLLKNLLENKSILIVLDNIESLLDSDLNWIDKRWGTLINTLLDHKGQSRIILTSRLLPKDLEIDGRLLQERLHALSLREAALLIREMPNLGKMFHNQKPAVQEGNRQLIARTLALVQGHPKLIELADAQAVDPKILANYLDRTERTWGDVGKLKVFFEQGESNQHADDFLKVLKVWTKDVISRLPESSKILFLFLCALEESDRISTITLDVWPRIWKHIKHDVDAPGFETSLKDLETAGLVDAQFLENDRTYIIHPGVAEAGQEDLNDAEKNIRTAVDSVMSESWTAKFEKARRSEMEDGGKDVVKDGLKVVPYLIRQGMCFEASAILAQVLHRDFSPGTAAAVIPYLRYIVDSRRGYNDELACSCTLAIALFNAGRKQEADNLIKSLISKCVNKGDYKSLLEAKGEFFKLLLRTGRRDEALEQVNEMKEYTSKLGLGPWTQLGHEARRLQILSVQGKYEEVLDTVEKLMEYAESLAEDEDQKEVLAPKHVKEVLLDAGRRAALRSHKYELALDINDRIKDSKKDRTRLALARAQLNDFIPLLKLGRDSEAKSLLLNCKVVIEQEGDLQGLGTIYDDLAEWEYKAGHIDLAENHETSALRLKYQGNRNPEDICISHRHLAKYLNSAGSNAAFAHCIAAAIISFQSDLVFLKSSLEWLTRVQCSTEYDAMPTNFIQLCSEVEKIKGVRFKLLFEEMPKNKAKDGDEALLSLIKMTGSQDRAID